MHDLCGIDAMNDLILARLRSDADQMQESRQIPAEDDEMTTAAMLGNTSTVVSLAAQSAVASDSRACRGARAEKAWRCR